MVYADVIPSESGINLVLALSVVFGRGIQLHNVAWNTIKDKFLPHKPVEALMHRCEHNDTAWIRQTASDIALSNWSHCHYVCLFAVLLVPLLLPLLPTKVFFKCA